MDERSGYLANEASPFHLGEASLFHPGEVDASRGVLQSEEVLRT